MAAHTTPSAAIPPTTPTKLAEVSSTMPLTFGVTATGRFHSPNQRRISAAFAGSTPSPMTTSGRFEPRSADTSVAACSRAPALESGVVATGARSAVGRRLQRLASGQREVRHAERALHAAGQRLRHHVEHVRAGDLLDITRDRPVGLVQRQQLVRVAGREIVRDLRRDRQQRLEVQIGVRHRQHQVRRARTQCRQHDARLAAQLAVDRRGDPRVRLVAHQDEVDAGAAELVHQHEHLAARQSEDALDAGIGQNSCGGGCGGWHWRIY